MHAARAQHNTFFILHMCKHACACKIDDVKSTVHSSRVCTRYVHDARMHVKNAHIKFELRVHANCKARTAK